MCNTPMLIVIRLIIISPLGRCRIFRDPEEFSLEGLVDNHPGYKWLIQYEPVSFLSTNINRRHRAD